jgi:light-harvesting complex I chlorophyll a/b binding protein 1
MPCCSCPAVFLSCSFDPLGLGPKDDPAAWKEMQTKELNNGRLAMIAIAAFTVEELVSHQEIFEHLALRFEKEIILELDDVEKDLNLPVTPVPALVLEELAN